MVFKLVRIDSTEPCKIKLPVGRHGVGRGKFLFENEGDNKVSRNHAELLVTDDEVTLIALHSNPCFYMLKQHQSHQILNKNSSIKLYCGDKFGILPHHFWYEVIFCSQVLEESETPKDVKKESDNVDQETDEDLSKELESDMNETGEQASASLYQRDSPTQHYEWRKTPSNNSEDEAENVQPQLKRPLAPDNEDEDDCKKAKSDDATADGAGPSNKASTSNDNADNNPIVRERCMYGASCYRKNPQHAAQYSHPADEDWAAGAARACPWGAACRRRDPRHRRDATHPPPAHPAHPAQPAHAPHAPHAAQPGHQPRGNKMIKSNDDSSPLIVTGKRKRNTLVRMSWSGSETDGERDPYGTDESEEWQPSEDLHDTTGPSQD